MVPESINTSLDNPVNRNTHLRPKGGFMKRILLLMLFLLGHGPLTEAQNLLNGPESIIYDSVGNRYFVTNINSGDIIQIDADGNYSVYYHGLRSTYGLEIVDDSLYVCCNFSEQEGIWTFDLTTDQMVSHIQPDGWVIGNDLASDTSGNLYCTDSFGNCLFKIRISDKYCERILFGQMPNPNGVFFDKYDNRLLVASNLNGYPILAVDLNTLLVTAATTFTGEFDHIARDQKNNIYVSHSSNGVVYRFDSTLSGTPDIVASGYLTPEGIIFNQAQSLLCIPILDEQRVVFQPMDIDIWATADAPLGWAPHTVSYEAGSESAIESWTWDFGDGQVGDGETPSHTYALPGVYDLTLEAVTTSGDTLTRLYRNEVLCLADTVWAGAGDVLNPDSAIVLTVFATNAVPVREISFSVQYDGDLALVFDSMSVEECRTDSFSSVDLIDYNSSYKQLAVRLTTRDYRSPWYLEGGSGPVAKLYFHAATPSMGQSTEIRLAEYDQFQLYFTSYGAEYAPTVRNAQVEYLGCCVSARGNVDGDAADQVDISDITFLVDYLFADGETPPCLYEANTDGDFDGDAYGQVNISDLTFLVEYLFGGGPPPPEC
jgi:hypothetical protein